jgi:hypothetical protein
MKPMQTVAAPMGLLRGRAVTAVLPVLLGSFLLAGDASAQQPVIQKVDVETSSSASSRAQRAAIDVNRLPIDVRRIQRGLAQSTRERVETNGMNLRYVIDVFGQAAPIELFTREDNLVYGPAPYGAPTHKDMIYMVTPEEFRAPAADFGALFRWLSDKAKK